MDRKKQVIKYRVMLFLDKIELAFKLIKLGNAKSI